jgi:hypothetical protein
MFAISSPRTTDDDTPAVLLSGDRATGTTLTLDGESFTVTADNRLFHGDKEVQLTQTDANRARGMAFFDDLYELHRLFGRYAHLAEYHTQLFDIRAFVAGHRGSFVVQAVGSNFYDACEQAREQLSAKLGVPTSSIATSLSPV